MFTTALTGAAGLALLDNERAAAEHLHCSRHRKAKACPLDLGAGGSVDGSAEGGVAVAVAGHSPQEVVVGAQLAGYVLAGAEAEDLVAKLQTAVALQQEVCLISSVPSSTRVPSTT